MNPLCPRCYAELDENSVLDLLECPSCDFSWSPTTSIASIAPDEEDQYVEEADPGYE